MMHQPPSTGRETGKKYIHFIICKCLFLAFFLLPSRLVAMDAGSDPMELFSCAVSKIFFLKLSDFQLFFKACWKQAVSWAFQYIHISVHHFSTAPFQPLLSCLQHVPTSFGWVDSKPQSREISCGKQAGLAAQLCRFTCIPLYTPSKLNAAFHRMCNILFLENIFLFLYCIFFWHKSEKVVSNLVSNSPQGERVFILLCTCITLSVWGKSTFEIHAGNLKSLLVKPNIIYTFYVHILNL